jgi:hypothetical protein
MSKHENSDGHCTVGAEIALTQDHTDALHFAEELDIFRILTSRIHRAATHLSIGGADSHIRMPDIEKQAAGLDDDLEHAWIDLDEVADTDAHGRPRKRTDAVTREIAAWREESTPW